MLQIAENMYINGTKYQMVLVHSKILIFGQVMATITKWPGHAHIWAHAF